jgi:hypothetical protein
MGGLVFANTSQKSGEPIRTPRITPELYQQLAEECRSKLQAHFGRVAIPREPPWKADYGDIDFLVGGIKSKVEDGVDLWKELKEAFGTKIHVQNGGSHSFAIPHPKEKDAYVQVDVELAPGDGTPDAAVLFEWTRFMKGDSDLLQIIGTSHRSLGLTCNDKGLHARVAEIEPYDAKKSMLLLTRDPDEAMRFYGLDPATYWTGFKDETELFDWATSGRFFYPQKYEKMVEKSNDRSRFDKRPMYKRFVLDYMPAHSDRGATNDWTRQQVLDEALKTFDKQAEYDIIIAAHQFKIDEEALWEEVKAALPVEGNPRRDALKGLRRWVVFENGEPKLTTTPTLDDKTVWTTEMAPGSKDSLLDWVKDNWEEAKSLERARASAVKAAAKSG